VGRAASPEADFVDFTFDGKLITDRSWNPRGAIETQLLYSVGQLNGDDSVSRLDDVKLDNVEVTERDEGGFVVTYTATMLVAWDKDNGEEPSLYLPKIVTISSRSSAQSSSYSGYLPMVCCSEGDIEAVSSRSQLRRAGR
jgi:hypothetical protein